MVSTQQVEAINEIFLRVPAEYEEAQRQLVLCDDETQDILHRLELLPLTYHERARLAARLCEVRQERRKLKDSIESMEPLMNWIQEFGAAKNKLSSVLGEMRKVDGRHNNRVYFVRTGENAGKPLLPPKGTTNK